MGYSPQKAVTWWGWADCARRLSKITGLPRGTSYKHKTFAHPGLTPCSHGGDSSWQGNKKAAFSTILSQQYHEPCQWRTASQLTLMSVAKPLQTPEQVHAVHWIRHTRTQFLSTATICIMHRDQCSNVSLTYYFTLFNHGIIDRIIVLMLSHSHTYLSHELDSKKSGCLDQLGTATGSWQRKETFL